MASERQNMSEQEISMKAREHELYVKPLPESDFKPVKPFEVYLRETPAEPFSPATKAILWMVAIVVGALFLAALWRVSTRHGPGARVKTSRPPAKATTSDHPTDAPVPPSRARAIRG